MRTVLTGCHYMGMEIRFIPQPLEGEANLSDFIDHATENNFDRLRISVAWAKQSGLGRIYDQIKSFRDQGGVVEMIVGVSEGGATVEGLNLTLELADKGYVFHHPARTFHPKVYVSEGSEGKSLFIGSNNLTAGGLAWNYEAALWIDWGPDENPQVVQDVHKWMDELISQDGSCRPLTRSLIRALDESPDLLLGSELRARRVSEQRGTAAPEDNDSTASGSAGGLFTRFEGRFRKLLPLSSAVPKLTGNRGGSKMANPVSKGMAKKPPSSSHSSVARRWYKELDHTAAQQPKSARTNPTGNLRLSQAESDIDHRSYFYETFFGGLPWSPRPGEDTEQEIMVNFHCWIDGTDYGKQEIRISHNPGRVAGQANVPTVLHWGPLGPVLRQTNYIGYFVSLELTAKEEYNLFISKTPRGEYIL